MAVTFPVVAGVTRSTARSSMGRLRVRIDRSHPGEGPGWDPSSRVNPLTRSRRNPDLSRGVRRRPAHGTDGLDQRLGLPPDLSPLGAQAGGQLDGLDQAGLVGHTLAGDVEGGPVVDGGADDGETYGDVNTLIEVEALEDRVALVVVHGDDEAVASLGGPG